MLRFTGWLTGCVLLAARRQKELNLEQLSGSGLLVDSKAACKEVQGASREGGSGGTGHQICQQGWKGSLERDTCFDRHWDLQLHLNDLT